MGGAIAAIAMAADRRLTERLRSRRAVTPDSAQPVDARPGMERRRLDRLVAKGIIVEARQGHYYLVESAWNSHLAQLQRRLILVVVLAVLVALAGILLVPPGT